MLVEHHHNARKPHAICNLHTLQNLLYTRDVLVCVSVFVCSHISYSLELERDSERLALTAGAATVCRFCTMDASCSTRRNTIIQNVRNKVQATPTISVMYSTNSHTSDRQHLRLPHCDTARRAVVFRMSVSHLLFDMPVCCS